MSLGLKGLSLSIDSYYIVYQFFTLGFKVVIPGGNDTIALLTGSKLVLNCTVEGNFHPPVEILWTSKHQHLPYQTLKLNSTTVQLVIERATAQYNGVFWCEVLNKTNQQVEVLAIKNVTVLIGGRIFLGAPCLVSVYFL